ncbi:MAG: MBL fold metallo-hydrolase [Acidobacteriia bacterium]|nr:MBL fold metallo-hydrolase [Terriglobia bacterium]
MANWVFLCALSVLCGGIASASVRKIAPDLYAYVSENDGSANATFLVTDRGILVVDTGVNGKEGENLLAEIRKISSAPVRYIVNTHYHPDHRGGNSVVGPAATIISTAFTRDQQAGHSEAYSAAADSLASSGRLTIYLGQYEVEIFHPGPAHTRGDVVVYFPLQHAVATGDLFLTNSCPAMDDGDMENWIAALDSILALDAQTFVPGHFEVASQPRLRRFRDYLAALRDQVKPRFAAGQPLSRIQAELEMKAFRDFRQFPQYEATFADNAASYFQQLTMRNKNGVHGTSLR